MLLAHTQHQHRTRHQDQDTHPNHAKSQSTHQYQDILSRVDNSLHKMGDKCPCQEATLLKVLNIHLREVDFLIL